MSAPRNTLALCLLLCAGSASAASEGGASWVAARPRCQTSPRDIIARRRAAGADRARPLPPRDPRLPLTLRDAFGDFAGPALSEHFALKSGPDRPLTTAEAQAALAELERAWSVEVTRMQIPAPAGADRYYVNAYVGNSGGGAPEISFVGAYASVDSQGLPYIAVHPTLIGSPELAGYLWHEFFHVLQSTLGVYTAETAGWYWEATAEWAVWQVDPPSVPAFAGFYFALPEYPLDYMDYPDTGAVIEYHHYGAAMFPLYLTEKIADWTLVRDSWTRASDEDPLRSFDTLLAARGRPSVAELLPDYAAHNALFDYADGAAFRAQVEANADYASLGGGDGIALHLSGKGSTGFIEVPVATAPFALGYNVIQLSAPSAGTLRVALNGKSTGTLGSASRFRAVVARRDAAGIHYVPLPLDAAGQSGTLEVLAAGEATELSLVVTALPPSHGDKEQFPYAMRFEITAADPPPATDAGCAMPGGRSAGGRLASTVLLLALLIFRRRLGV